MENGFFSMNIEKSKEHSVSIETKIVNQNSIDNFGCRNAVPPNICRK